MKLMIMFFLACGLVGLFAPRMSARPQWLIIAASVAITALYYFSNRFM
jgi:hypothetical protein